MGNNWIEMRVEVADASLVPGNPNYLGGRTAVFALEGTNFACCTIRHGAAQSSCPYPGRIEDGQCVCPRKGLNILSIIIIMKNF